MGAHVLEEAKERALVDGIIESIERQVSSMDRSNSLEDDTTPVGENEGVLVENSELVKENNVEISATVPSMDSQKAALSVISTGRRRHKSYKKRKVSRLESTRKSDNCPMMAQTIVPGIVARTRNHLLVAQR